MGSVSATTSAFTTFYNTENPYLALAEGAAGIFSEGSEVDPIIRTEEWGHIKSPDSAVAISCVLA